MSNEKSFVEYSPKPNQSKLERFGIHRNLIKALDWVEQGKALYRRSSEYNHIGNEKDTANARACNVLAEECFEQAMRLNTLESFQDPETGKYGFRNKETGEIVVAPEYPYVGKFSYYGGEFIAYLGDNQYLTLDCKIHTLSPDEI